MPTKKKKSEEPKKAPTVVAEREETTPPDFTEIREADMVPVNTTEEEQEQEEGMISIRAVEFGKLPTTIPVETGKKISDLIEEEVISPGQEFYVNGTLVNEDYTLQEGDALVGAPRTGGGK